MVIYLQGQWIVIFVNTRHDTNLGREHIGKAMAKWAKARKYNPVGTVYTLQDIN
jgi:hypothetical protein